MDPEAPGDRRPGGEKREGSPGSPGQRGAPASGRRRRRADGEGALRESRGRSARFGAGRTLGGQRREPGRARAAGLTALVAAPDSRGPGASCLLRRDLRLFMAKAGQSRSRRARRACPAGQLSSLRDGSARRSPRSRPHLPPEGPGRPAAPGLRRRPAARSQSAGGLAGGLDGLGQSESGKGAGLPLLT